MLSNTLKLQHLYSAQRIIFMKSKTLVKALIFLIAANIICISSFFVIINVMKNDENHENGSYSERDSEKDTNDDKYLNVIAFEPAEDTVLTKEQLSNICEVLKNRLTANGYTDAKVQKYGSKKIKVKFSDSDIPTGEISEMLCSEAKLSFNDYIGNELLGGSDIKSAKASRDTLISESNEYVVKLRFSAEGANKFAEATEKISGYTDGNNVIAIMLDDEMISCPTVNSRIDTDECYIQGGFDKDSAEKLAAMISCGQLPFSLKETSQ